MKFEDLISNLSTKFISLTSQEIDNEINWGLKKLGEFVDADRSYIFLIEEKKGVLNNTHEWCAPGVSPEINNLQGLDIDTFPWIMEKLRNLERVSIPDVNKLPSKAVAEKEILQAQDIKSALMIPIPYGDSLLGFIGIDSVADNAVWNENILQLLKLVGEMFGNALRRREYEEELETS